MRQLQATLTQIFIVLESESHGFFGQNRKLPKNRWSPKKKKRSSPKLRRLFRPKSEIRTVFQPKNRWSPKKKVFTEIETDFLAKFGNSNGFSGRITTTTSQLRQPNSFGGGCFYYFSKNRPQKHQKLAIFHTLQVNEGARAPPPGYATEFSTAQ